MVNKAVVALSGGQDSTTVLYWALQSGRFDEVHAISFDYGQRHKRELDCAIRIAASTTGVKTHQILDLPALRQLGDAALTNPDIEVNPTGGRGGLPSTFVPGRNVLFFTLAAGYAYKLEARNIVSGVCQTDYSGYPDCRRDFCDEWEKMWKLATEWEVKVHTPLMFLTKAESIKLAAGMPGCFDALAMSHTCYQGAFPPCGKCPACEIRAKGFEQAGVPDPLLASQRA